MLDGSHIAVCIFDCPLISKANKRKFFLDALVGQDFQNQKFLDIFSKHEKILCFNVTKWIACTGIFDVFALSKDLSKYRQIK